MTENKELVRTYYERILNRRETNLFDALFSEDFRSHLSDGTFLAKPQYKGMMQFMLTAIPDVAVSVEEQFADGDAVITRWSATGTPISDFGAIKATGGKIRVTAIHIHKVRGGTITEHWEAINLHAVARL